MSAKMLLWLSARVAEDYANRGYDIEEMDWFSYQRNWQFLKSPKTWCEDMLRCFAKFKRNPLMILGRPQQDIFKEQIYATIFRQESTELARVARLCLTFCNDSHPETEIMLYLRTQLKSYIDEEDQCFRRLEAKSAEQSSGNVDEENSEISVSQG